MAKKNEIVTIENKQMSLFRQIHSFEGREIRSTWNEKDEQWYFVVEDVVEVLTDSKDPKQYVKRMKLRDPELAKGGVQIVPILPVETEGGVTTALPESPYPTSSAIYNILGQPVSTSRGTN